MSCCLVVCHLLPAGAAKSCLGNRNLPHRSAGTRTRYWLVLRCPIVLLYCMSFLRLPITLGIVGYQTIANLPIHQAVSSIHRRHHPYRRISTNIDIVI